MDLADLVHAGRLTPLGHRDRAAIAELRGRVHAPADYLRPYRVAQRMEHRHPSLPRPECLKYDLQKAEPLTEHEAWFNPLLDDWASLGAASALNLRALRDVKQPGSMSQSWTNLTKCAAP